jgi:hypothetical protein
LTAIEQVAVKPVSQPYPPSCSCDKGKKSTPGFETYAPNTGVALILLRLPVSTPDVKEFLRKSAISIALKGKRRNY